MGLLDKLRQAKSEKEDETAISALEHRVGAVERRVAVLEGRAKVILQRRSGGKHGQRQPA